MCNYWHCIVRRSWAPVRGALQVSVMMMMMMTPHNSRRREWRKWKKKALRDDVQQRKVWRWWTRLDRDLSSTSSWTRMSRSLVSASQTHSWPSTLAVHTLHTPYTLQLNPESKIRTVTKGFDPRLAHRPFLVFDFRALWRSALSARAPESQKLKMVG